MKFIKLLAILMVAAMVIFPVSNYVYARGGGHSGGGHRGGWSGGHGHHGGHGNHHHGHHGNHHNGHHGNHNNHNHSHNNNHNHTNVNVYGGGYGWGWGWGWGWGGGWGWGAADAAIAGLAVGTAIGVTSQPSTVIVEQQAPVPQQAVAVAPAYGTQVAMLPVGAISKNVQGTMIYQCGAVWYKPYFGSNGVYYEVVQPPPTGS